MESLAGKVVFITGASSGIGAAAARLFAKHKARLALHGRNSERLKHVADQCRDIGGLAEQDVILITCDIGDVQQVRVAAAKVLDHFQTIHCLVNNAGYSSKESLTYDVPLEDMDAMMAVHMHSPLLLSQLFMEELKKNKGSIINVSSVLGLIPHSGLPHYCIAKAAMNHMTKCLALDVIKTGVRINAVCPGVTVTPFFSASDSAENRQTTAKMMEDIGKATNVGRAAVPEEIAHPIVFLASDAASYITGQCLAVDGGHTLSAKL